jgi:CrcB protein
VTVLLVALGAALGAPMRYLTDRAVQGRHRSQFPAGTLAVNVAACFLLGLVTGATTSGELRALVGTGFCGALSTYSTFSFETMRLAENGRRMQATANVLLSVVLGLGAAALGVLASGA